MPTYLKNLCFWQKFQFQTLTLHRQNLTAYEPTCFIFLMSNTTLFSFTKRYQAWGYLKQQRSYSTLNVVPTYFKNLRFWEKFLFQTSTLHRQNFTAHEPTCFIFLMSNNTLFSFTKKYLAWGYLKKQQSNSTLNVVPTYLKNLRFWQKFLFQTSTLHRHNFTAHNLHALFLHE